MKLIRFRMVAWLGSLVLLLVLVWIAAGCGLHRRHFPAKSKVESSRQQEVQGRLKRSIEALARGIGERNVYRPGNARRAHDWIVQEFTGAGYPNVNTQVFLLHDEFKLDARLMAQEGRNIEVEIEGTSKEAGIIVVGAHYDTMAYNTQWGGIDNDGFRTKFPGTPGANDNASGIAALLQLARMFRDSAGGQPSRFPRTVRFVAFDNEEPPFFQERHVMGSSVYAQRCRASNDNIVMMMSLDTMAVYSRTDENAKRRWFMWWLRPFHGLKAKPDYVAFMSNREADSGRKAVEWARVFASHSRIDVRTICLPFMPSFGKEIFAWSDDWSFTRVGYPAFTVTDTAFYRSDRYHELWDTPERLRQEDYASFADVVLGLHGMLLQMANTDK